METCKNCEKKFDESYSFCPYCGQQAKDDLTVKVLFYNTISNYFSFDARFFKSFFPLLLKPGFIAREFVDGKRLRYLHPAQMYLFITVMFFFLFSFIKRNQVQDLDAKLADTLQKDRLIESINNEREKDSIENALNAAERIKDSLTVSKAKEILKSNELLGLTEEEVDSIIDIDINKNSSIEMSLNARISTIDSLINNQAGDDEIYAALGMGENASYWEQRFYKQVLRFYRTKKGGSILEAFYDTIPIALFFLLPIFALILKLLYFKRGSYAHHLVLSFYYFSFLFTVFSLIIGVNFVIDIPNALDFLIMLSTFFYLIIALKKFYKQGWFKSIIKSVVASFVFLSVVAPITFVFLVVFAFLFY